MGKSKFKTGRVLFRNSGMTGLNIFHYESENHNPGSFMHNLNHVNVGDDGGYLRLKENVVALLRDRAGCCYPADKKEHIYK